MANKEQLQRLLNSTKEENECKAWNDWRSKHPDIKIDLKEANLRSANLYSANLDSANLQSANLIWANLHSANLRSADLDSANLTLACLFAAHMPLANFQSAIMRSVNLYSANLGAANMRMANLARSNLKAVNLHSANLELANLQSVNLDSANLKEADLFTAQTNLTVWANVDLSKVKEGCLETIEHKGPSTVGTDTLLNSKGAIPKEFLEGCGLQNWEIETTRLYKPGITREEQCEIYNKIQDARFGGPLPIGGVFISYSHSDKEFVIEIEEKLKAEGARVWRDEHALKAGDLNKQIWKGLRSQDVVLLVLSKNSTESDWVESELEMARYREKEEGREILCPIALDNSWEDKCEAGGTDRQLWRTLKKKVILPFKKNRSDFEIEIRKLVEGLRENYQVAENS